VNITRFLDWLQARVTVRTAVVSLSTVVAVLLAFFFVGAEWLERRMGGQQVLDVMFWPIDRPWRSPEVVTSTLEAYGDRGRRWYLGVLLVDTMFAGLYSVLLTVWDAFAARQLHLSNKWARRATIIPLFGGLVCDWGENLLLGLQTVRFPNQNVNVSQVAFVLSELKFVAYLETLFLLLAVVVLTIIRRIIRR